MSDGELIELIENNMSKGEDELYYIDLVALIQTVDYKYAIKLSKILAKYSKDKGISIVTAKQQIKK